MRFSSLLLGASLAALAVPAAAQTQTTRDGTGATVRVQTAAPAAGGETPPQPTTSLAEALWQTYNTNPNLAVERANQRANDENVPIARSRAIPGVNGTGSLSDSVYDSDATFGPTRRAQLGVNLTVPVYNGGSVRNSIRAAETRVDAGVSNLRGTESDVFTQAVTAYSDVIRDEAIVRLNQQNVRVLEVNLQATRDRFEVGDLTRTDVAQSEARLALAQGQLRTAEARLIGSRETYIRVIGVAPGVLAPPPPLPELPDDPLAAEQIALANNPFLDAAEKARIAARYDVSVARANRLPTLSLGVNNTYYNNLGSVGAQARAFGTAEDGFANSLTAQLTLPIFQGGRPAAQIRQAQARQAAAIEQVTLTERGVVAQVRSALATYQSSLRVIESSRVAVQANQLSLEGVRAENSVGTRTILEILNAEQELLNAQVQYVTAERDAYVAGFSLLAAMGRAQAADLGLQGGPLYDPEANYKRVRNRWGDWTNDPEPTAVSTRTAGTTPQKADVTPGQLNPILQRPVDTTVTNP